MKCSIMAWCVVILFVEGCVKVRPNASNAAAQEPHEATLTHDFGKVLIDSGPQVLRHTFRVANGRQKSINVLAISPSCGCLDVTSSTHDLPPGTTADITLTLNVEKPGHTVQGAIVQFSDNTAITLKVSAYGTRGFEIKAVRRAVMPDHNGRVPVRFYAVDSEGEGEVGAPILQSPSGVTLAFHGWHDIESRRQNSSRPTRQVANAHLDFSEYQGNFPVRVVFQTGVGAICRLQVGQLPVASCDGSTVYSTDVSWVGN